jgi:bacteriocin-like protein
MKGVNMGKQKQWKPTKEPKTTEVATELTDEELSKVSGGTFKAFANFGDIKGESTDKDHKDWVMI